MTEVHPFEWTAEREAELKKLLHDGLSASGIARKFGCSRSAVMGKAYRLRRAAGIAPQPAHIREKKAPQHKPSLPVVAAGKRPLRHMPAPAPVLQGNASVTIATLQTGQCKWPFSDPGSDEFCFCGQTAEESKPYCAYHTGIARGAA